jgi:Flp pilus assembly protein TadD
MTPGEIILNALGSALARFPASASLCFERARIADAIGEGDAAEADYRRAIALAPRFFRAHNDLGLFYYRRNRLVDALHCFLTAVEVDDADPAGHANLGALLLAGEDLEGAKSAFERALALAPDQPTALAGLAAVCERLGFAPPPPPEARPAAPGPGASPAASPPDPFLDYVFEIAAGAVLAGEGEAALAFVEAAAGADPRCVALLWRVADMAGSQRAFAIALTFFDRALVREPGNIDLHRGRAIVLEEGGDTAAARVAWSSAPLRGAMRVVPFTGGGEPVRLLTIASALHAIRYELFTDPARMINTVLYTQGYAPEMPLPLHDVVLVAVADVESDADALAVAAAIVARTTAPVINRPGCVLATSRVTQARRLAEIAGVTTPHIIEVSRAAMLRRGAGAMLHDLGFAYPVLLRSPGFHNGRFFEMVRDDAEASRVTATMPRDEILAISYHDTRGSDGLVRKYRVMAIGGVLYPVHLAISAHWKVHYVSSAMAEHAALRSEEAAFLNDMDATLGAPAISALRAIAATMELDYAGIDFGLTADGRVVVYEANGAMAIFLPDADPRWDYRRAAMTAALDAATQMIVDRGTRGRA